MTRFVDSTFFRVSIGYGLTSAAIRHNTPAASCLPRSVVKRAKKLGIYKRRNFWRMLNLHVTVAGCDEFLEDWLHVVRVAPACPMLTAQALDLSTQVLQVSYFNKLTKV
jgi:hypothetical protein